MMMEENYDNVSPRSVERVDEELGPEGCYLVYEPDSGGRLMVVYSRGYVPMNAIGFWCAGAHHKGIQSFKFKQAGGRSELIKGIAGGDSNRRKYFVGWCQFIKMAKAMDGRVIKFPNAIQGVEVDIYGYRQADSQPEYLPLDDMLVDVTTYDAISVVPKHKEFLRGVKSIVASNFLEMGNIAGASSTMV